MIYFIVSSEQTTYRDTALEAARAAGAKPWNWAALTRAVSQLELGDELSVDSDVSVFAISGKDIDFKG
jgi:hypothetical protein